MPEYSKPCYRCGATVTTGSDICWRCQSARDRAAQASVDALAASLRAARPPKFNGGSRSAKARHALEKAEALNAARARQYPPEQ